MLKEDDHKIIEQSILLPMLLTILERDRMIFEQLPVKLKPPYLNLIEKTMKVVQKDLKDVKLKMKKGNMKAYEISRDSGFTGYMFVCRGFEEQHNYFNLNIRNKIEILLEHYLNKHSNAPTQKE
ncbi:peptidoglycan recognition protein [Bacillus phage vB_Bacillus_1020A]|uniref:hypothetical protein n=1 Tax=Robertmurraya sp. DFI.2.37 TaxID=3031819 RepID=UPI001860B3EC|nr:hypothetical protein [Robertmurraya sp. DFI.2.37]MDF1510838.1 hypothetical protein [Robertmurraya sp. DFI.2.37]QIW89319.1 peptidoglycan recognition protein [Bacillus phage vB_Bacillus_1020A]